VKGKTAVSDRLHT